MMENHLKISEDTYFFIKIFIFIFLSFLKTRFRRGRYILFESALERKKKNGGTWERGPANV